MNGLPKLPDERPGQGIQPLAGRDVVSIPLPARSDLSDWVDLMDVVEALCPKWPAPPTARYRVFKL